MKEAGVKAANLVNEKVTFVVLRPAGTVQLFRGEIALVG